MSTLAFSYETVDERPFDTHYVWADADFDHPIETVWEQALDIPSWMGANHEWEPVTGETGKPGMLYRLWPRKHYLVESGVEGECPPPHFHFVGIARVIRHKLIGVEVWPEKGGSYGGLVEASHKGLDSLVFTDLGGGRTNVKGLFIAVEDRKPDQHIDTSEEENIAANVMLHFDNLRKVIDGIPLDTPKTDTYRTDDAGS
jgi:hypothetical protein